MLETLRISFTLKNTYRVNAILHGLKRFPLIGKLLPADVYRVHWLKVFATVISVLWELFAAFWGKFFYLSVMIFLPTLAYSTESADDIFLHILLIQTIVGGFLNAYLFETGMDKYYALIQLKMDAKKYTLINFGYALLKVLIGFIVFGMHFGLLSELTVWQCLLIPFDVIARKIIHAAYDLYRYEKTGTAASEVQAGGRRAIVLLILLGAAYVPPFVRQSNSIRSQYHTDGSHDHGGDIWGRQNPQIQRLSAGLSACVKSVHVTDGRGKGQCNGDKPRENRDGYPNHQ